jgi:hypothetical protein
MDTADETGGLLLQQQRSRSACTAGARPMRSVVVILKIHPKIEPLKC